MRFTHLHCHSYHSMMRGTASLEKLCQKASQLHMESLALTDWNGLYGWVEFVQHCNSYRLRPLCGVDLHAEEASAVLLAKDPKGYERICRIISDRHLEPHFSLTQTLLEDRFHLAVVSRDLALLETLARETGPEDLYTEIVPGEENHPRLAFSRRTGILPVATNDVYLSDPVEFPIHQMLRAIDLNTCLSRLPVSECASAQRFFADEEWMRSKLSFIPEALENARTLAQSLYSGWRLGDILFPPFEEFTNPEAFFTLRWKCYQGATRRYGKLNQKITDRLEYELKIIREKGFTHYFLVVDDIVKQAPRTCGRGSVAASLVSYCLGITQVDPIAHNLFFERFLNPGRKDPPDADIDFPWDERDKIMDYVFQKYGPTRAACVANHVRLQPQAVVREVAKVFGVPDAEITRFTEKIFQFFPQNLPDPWSRIFNWGRYLEEIPRYLSVHCGGVVIVPDDLRRYVPLQRATKGVNIIQWEKDQTEDFGLVKIDLLGNRSLAVVRDALKAVAENTGKPIAYEGFNPIHDPETQATIARGETMGVFYIESPATRQLQRKARVGDYEHVVIHSSIIRPAANRFINEYVERLHGKPFKALHPALEEILKETYGIMVYQEDVTKTAMALAGFDAVEGDGLRKALSKKRTDRKLKEYFERFHQGAIERGVSSKTIEQVWEMMMSFAGYSFCKPHSASYALVSFQSAYLRAHHPAEFIAAVISNRGGFYSTFAYISEARRMGLTIEPPDINESQIAYTGKENVLRIGLQQLKNVNEKSLKILMEERQHGGYQSLENFLMRVSIPLSDTKLLIRAGCFDRIEKNLNRPQILWKLMQIYRPHSEGELPFQSASRPWTPAIGDYTEYEKMNDELEIFGFLFRRHPLTLYEAVLRSIPHVLACSLDGHVGKRVRMVGWLITGKVVWTKNDEPMEFLSFEDLTGIYETTFFPNAYKQYAPLLNARQPFLLEGKVETELGALSLNVWKVTPLRSESVFQSTLGLLH